MEKHHIIDRIWDLTMEQIISKRRTALKEYRSIQESSIILRKTHHLEDLAEARDAVRNNTNKATELRQLQEHKHQRSMARRRRYLYGKTKGGGITSVIAPDEAGDLVEMTSKTDMERAIMVENKSKYHQVSQTLFMQPPLVHDFGYLGIGPNAEAVNARRVSDSSSSRFVHGKVHRTITDGTRDCKFTSN
jgi:hypothetical protein